MWPLFRIILSSVFLLSIVLSVPVAFDVGGRDSGLAYSLGLFIFYNVYSFIKAVTPPTSNFRWLVSTLLRLSQWIVIPALLIWALNRYAVDAGSTDWVTRTVAPLFAHKHATWREWFFGTGGVVETIALGGWDRTLRYSSPVFQLLEGFCSLLVIQQAGRISRYLVNRGRSDLWVVCVISGAMHV